MQLILFHNQKAGSGKYTRSQLLTFLDEAGHQVNVFSLARDDLERGLRERADLIVIAGGDGAVTKVINGATAKGAPLAIFPLGTANNIATSLGIKGHPRALIESWKVLNIRPFYRLKAKGPWGRRRIVEGIGFGAFEQAMDEMGSHKPDVAGARKWLAEAILRTPPERLAVELDAAALTDEFALLEVTNIPFVGPRVHLAPFANPSDPLMTVSYVGSGDRERRAFSRWLKRAPANEPPPVTTHSVRRVFIEGEIQRVRLNDKNWNGTSATQGTVVIEAGVKPLHFLVPHQATATNESD
jgi:diacylglycerol kinase family enzyme